MASSAIENKDEVRYTNVLFTELNI